MKWLQRGHYTRYQLALQLGQHNQMKWLQKE
jgi:hypothetical protein